MPPQKLFISLPTLTQRAAHYHTPEPPTLEALTPLPLNNFDKAVKP